MRSSVASLLPRMAKAPLRRVKKNTASYLKCNYLLAFRGLIYNYIYNLVN
jgi:hypothetical protein